MSSSRYKRTTSTDTFVRGSVYQTSLAVSTSSTGLTTNVSKHQSFYDFLASRIYPNSPWQSSHSSTEVDMSIDYQSIHDPKCPNHQGSCCPWMGDCECQCLCDFIREIRAEYLNIPEEPPIGTVIQCDGCGEEYHRIGSNWWSMDGECIRKWWDLMTEEESCGEYRIVYLHTVED